MDYTEPDDDEQEPEALKLGSEHELDSDYEFISQEFDLDENEFEYLIKIFKVHSWKGQREYCFSALPSEFPIIDKIRNEYGAGIYEVRVYSRQGRKNKLVKKPIYRIAEQKGPVNETSQKSDLAGLFQEVMKQQERQQRELRELLSRRNQPGASVDWLKWIPVIASALGELRNFMAPHGAAADPIDQFARFMQLKELLADSDARDTNTADVMLGLVNAFGPQLASMVSQMQAQDLAKLSAAPETKQMQNDQTKPTIDPRVKQLKLGLLLLCNAAQLHAPIDGYVGLVLDNFDDEQIQKFLHTENYLNQLAILHPCVKKYAQWFGALRHAILAAVAESEPEPDEQEPGDPGEHSENAD